MEQLDHNNLALLLGAALLLVGVLSMLVASRFGAPLLLFFLVIGMMVGEDGLVGLRFDNFVAAHLVGSAALAIILFDGGLRTKARALRGILLPAGILATAGVLVTALLCALAAMPLFGLSFGPAFLLGSVVASTDAAAVFFLVRTGGLRLRPRVNDTLEVESSTNDPFAIFLVIALVTLMMPGEAAVPTLVKVFAEQMILGAVLGLAGGHALSWLLNRTNFPAGLTAILVAAGAMFVYGGTAVLGGSGFLAVYLAGLVVANRPTRAVAGVIAFTDAVTWLAQIVMFVLLGVLATPHRLWGLLLPAAAFAAVLMLLARPAAVLLCLLPFRFRWSEKLFIGWVGLRGAVAIFLATIPVVAGMPNGLLYYDVAFFVVLVSLLLQGWTVRAAARVLRMALPGADHPESRTELDLPRQMEQELVGYPVRKDSAYLGHSRLPVWAKLVFVVRGERILVPAEAGPVVAGDYVYLLSPPMRAAGLDRFFSETEVERVEGEVYFGEFTVAGPTAMRELATLYAPGATVPDLTVREAFTRAFGRPAVGDTVPLGTAELVAKTIEDEVVVEAGLRLEPEPVRERLRRLAQRFRLARRAAAAAP